MNFKKANIYIMTGKLTFLNSTLHQHSCCYFYILKQKLQYFADLCLKSYTLSARDLIEIELTLYHIQFQNVRFVSLKYAVHFDIYIYITVV